MAISGSGGTSAIRERGGYCLNGSKIFITYAGVGEIITVTAVTDPSGGTWGISVMRKQFCQNIQELQPVQFRLPDMSMRTTFQAFQILGGAGYTSDYLI